MCEPACFCIILQLRQADALLLSCLVKGAEVVDQCGQEANTEMEFLLGQAELLAKLRAAGVRTDTVVAVIQIEHRVTQGFQLVVVMVSVSILEVKCEQLKLKSFSVISASSP